MEERFPCPCCDRLTLDEQPPGTYGICEECGWEDDEVQYHDVDFRGGANHESLREARENYRRHGSHAAPPWPPPRTRAELPRSDGSERSQGGTLRREGGDTDLPR